MHAKWVTHCGASDQRSQRVAQLEVPLGAMALSGFPLTFLIARWRPVCVIGQSVHGDMEETATVVEYKIFIGLRGPVGAWKMG